MVLDCRNVIPQHSPTTQGGLHMAWDFETDPEFQEQLDWVDAFVREEVEPLDLIWGGLEFTPPSAELKAVIDPLKQQVRDRGLWATHLGPELGGKGHGQLQA